MSSYAISRALVCLAAVSLAACAPSFEAVRASAARELSCPSGDVEVHWQSDLDYAAAGCGRTTYLRCAAKHDGECRVVADARALAQMQSFQNGALVDPSPLPTAWAELSLSVVGPARAPQKLKTCIDEARSAGVRLREEAPAKATLYLGDDGNRVTLADNRGSKPLGPWNSPAVCRAAIAAAVSVQERVRVIHGAAPATCREIGALEGRDLGLGTLPSYEAALATIEFTALRLGANFVVLDAMREIDNMLVLNGRAYDCRSTPAAIPGEKSI